MALFGEMIIGGEMVGSAIPSNHVKLMLVSCWSILTKSML
jgi:hypothetical protein